MHGEMSVRLVLDPFGMHVEWTTLQAIAKTGARVWYLVPYLRVCIGERQNA